MWRSKSLGMISVAMALVAIFALPMVAEADDRRHGEEDHRYGFGIGVGIVDTEGEGDFYGTAAFRIRLGKDDDKRRKANRGGIVGYVEPEIGYWSRSDSGIDASDLHLGVNLLGVVPTRTVEYFVGVGVGVHSLDTEFTLDGTTLLDDDDTVFGANLQVGIDVDVSDNVALFGVGRFDLLEGQIFDSQSKVYVGLRFKF